MYTALPTPTLVWTSISFSFLFILPTGNKRPAFDDRVFPELIAAFALPILALAALTAGGLGLGATLKGAPDMLSREPVRARAAFNFFFSRL